MISSKNIDRLCLAVIALTLVLTVLFMNGEQLGIEVLSRGENADAMFTKADLDGAWNTDGATVITLNGDCAAVRGNGAYFADGDLHIVYAGNYLLSGELTDGTVIVDADGDDKIRLLFDGVKLSCKTAPALQIEQADKVTVTLAADTESYISCGENFSDDTTDGAIYSRDDLTVNGDGTLTVSAGYKHGIVCNDDLVFAGGTVEVTAKEDALHANDSVRIRDTKLTLNAGDDGITASNDEGSSFVYVQSGEIHIPSCYEGIEAITVTVAGGTIDISPADDGINANGRGESSIEISDGEISIVNPDGRDADGLDSNGSITVSGGTLFVCVPGDGSSNSVDYGSEDGGSFVIDGGTVCCFGGSTMQEGVSAESKQGVIFKKADRQSDGTQVVLTDADGKELIHETVPTGFSAAILSAPDMKTGDTFTLTLGETSEEITATANESTGSFGGRGGFGEKNGEDTENPTPPVGQNGQPPELPDGFDGETPQMPDGQGERMQPPDENFGRFDRENGQIPGRNRNEFSEKETAKKQTREKSTDKSRGNGGNASVTVLLITVSALILAVGILLAFRLF